MRPERKAYHRSFWIWSAYSYLQSWRLIVDEWLAAAKDPSKQRVFLNDTAGLAYKAAGEAPPWEALRNRAEQSTTRRGVIPAGFVLLSMGLDVQKDRVEWQLVAWARDGRRAVVDIGLVPGAIDEKSTRSLLDGLMAQSWPNETGHRIAPDMAAIDGNAWTEDVWGFAKRHPVSKLIMVRGRGEDHAALFAKVKKERHRTSGKILRYSSRFYNFGTSILKMALYRHLAKTDPMAEGAVLFPPGLGDEYYRQLTAEKRVEEKNRSGFTVWKWTKDANQANEMLDTHLQAEAAALKAGLRGMTDSIWDRLIAEREAPVERVQLDLEDMLLMGSPSPVAQNTSPPETAPQSAASAKPTAPPNPNRARVKTLAARLAAQGED